MGGTNQENGIVWEAPTEKMNFSGGTNQENGIVWEAPTEKIGILWEAPTEKIEILATSISNVREQSA